eukprot:m.64007 g.64007  ORF g.64007 m.64007 type:complete len:66 (-) comp11985_c0_seq1:2881-3078(-)
MLGAKQTKPKPHNGSTKSDDGNNLSSRVWHSDSVGETNGTENKTIKIIDEPNFVNMPETTGHTFT